jgi:SCP-2 sterol transfer family
MSDETDEFFNDLARRGHEPLLEIADGIVLFEVTQGSAIDRWWVQIRHGDITVSRTGSAADTVVHVDRARSNAIFAGRINPITSVWRGALRVDGNAELIVLMVQSLIRARLNAADTVGAALKGR